MRKIKTKQELQKSKKRNTLFIGITLVGLMLLSSLGYAFLSNEKENTGSSKEYNGFKFFQSQSGWVFSLENQNFYFTYLPQEVENISVAGSYSLQDYTNKPLYFVNNNQASGEILNNLGRYVLRYQDACLNENCSGELPVKNCTDNLIVFQSGSEERVYREAHCVYISGDFIKASDAFLYKLMGIR